MYNLKRRNALKKLVILHYGNIVTFQWMVDSHVVASSNHVPCDYSKARVAINKLQNVT